MIEKVNLMVGRSGRHIRADVSGVVVCKAFLSGMPVRDPNRPISDRVAPPFHSHSHGCMRNHSTRTLGLVLRLQMRTLRADV